MFVKKKKRRRQEKFKNRLLVCKWSIVKRCMIEEISVRIRKSEERRPSWHGRTTSFPTWSAFPTHISSILTASCRSEAVLENLNFRKQFDYLSIECFVMAVWCKDMEISLAWKFREWPKFNRFFPLFLFRGPTRQKYPPYTVSGYSFYWTLLKVTTRHNDSVYRFWLLDDAARSVVAEILYWSFVLGEGSVVHWFADQTAYQLLLAGYFVQ